MDLTSMLINKLHLTLLLEKVNFRYGLLDFL